MKFLEKLWKPIKEGNEYRASLPKRKYNGSLADTRKMVAAQKADLNPIMCTKSAEELALYKASFGYWDEWTGARFSRRVSPYAYMSAAQWQRSKLGCHPKPKVDLKSVCKSNPITGGWGPIEEGV